MDYEGLLIISLLKIMAAFGLVFVYLPKRIFPQRSGAEPIEAFFENFALMAFFSILLVHLLALLDIYSLPFLLIGYFLLYLGVRWFREGESLPAAMQQELIAFNVFVLRTLDGLIDIRKLLEEHFDKMKQEWKRKLSSLSWCAQIVLFSAVACLAAWYRISDALWRAPLAFSDAYSHLEALKMLEAGRPYFDGLYPRGFHAFVSVIRQVTWLDPVLVMKLIGPLVGVLIVLSVYYATFRLTQNRNAALIGTLVVAIVDGWSSTLFASLGTSYWAQFFGLRTDAPFMLNTRQTGSLPQEFAMVFLLPALLFAHTYWTGKGSRRDLALLFASTAIVCMTHWIVEVVLVVALAILTGLALCRRGLSSKLLKRGFGAYILAGILGNFQLLGYLAAAASGQANGVQADYARRLVGGYGHWLKFWSDPIPVPPVLYASAILAVALCLYGLLVVKGADHRTLWLFLGVFTLVLLFAIRSVNYGVRYVIPPDRTGQFLGLVFPVGVGGLWNMITGFNPRRGSLPWYASLHQAVTIVALSGVAIVGMPPGFSSAPRYEYDSLARLYFQISREYPPLQWTIVSNVEDYSKVLGRGWHIDVRDFLASYNPSDPTIDIPTPYVFLFVEKKPLQVVTTYQDPIARQDEQRRLAEWAFIRGASHNDLTLYYEDNTVLVYLLQPHAGSMTENGLRHASHPRS